MPRSCNEIDPFKYWTNCGVATSLFQRAYAASETQFPLRKWATDAVAIFQLPGWFVARLATLPASGSPGSAWQC